MQRPSNRSSISPRQAVLRFPIHPGMREPPIPRQLERPTTQRPEDVQAPTSTAPAVTVALIRQAGLSIGPAPLLAKMCASSGASAERPLATHEQSCHPRKRAGAQRVSHRRSRPNDPRRRIELTTKSVIRRDCSVPRSRKLGTVDGSESRSSPFCFLWDPAASLGARPAPCFRSARSVGGDASGVSDRARVGGPAGPSAFACRPRRKRQLTEVA